MTLRLRPYSEKDADTILSWNKDEIAFYKWTAGVLGEYPLSTEQFNAVKKQSKTAWHLQQLMTMKSSAFSH